MSGEDDFEPTLGRSGKERRSRPRSQLNALARSARWGKVRTYSRPKLAWGAVRHNGRGKGAAAITHHHAHPARRRLFLKTSIAVSGPSGTKAFAAHISYIARDGTSRGGEGGGIFDRACDNADPDVFNDRARRDVRQFRWMISPDDAGDLEDLTRLTRTLMNQVERDLRCEVDWVAAGHFNTAHPHVHVAIRGGVPGADELIIARRYLIHGLRHRIEDTLTRELGYRRSLDLVADLGREAAQDRYTRIDRDLEVASRSGVIDLHASGARPALAPWSIQLRRLTHLRSRGLAEHLGGSSWRLHPGWAGTLREMGRQWQAERELSHFLGGEIDPGNLHEFVPGAPGAVTGRFAGAAAEASATGHHIALLEGLDGRQWTARISARAAGSLPEAGGVITFLPGSAGPPARHASERSERRPAPASGVKVEVEAWIPVESQVRRAAFTWLDQVAETDLAGARGFGAKVRAACEDRQLWLKARGLFPPRREKLASLELDEIGAREARRLGKAFDRDAGRSNFRGTYEGHVDTAQGRLGIIAARARFALARLPEGRTPLTGQEVVIEHGNLVIGRVLGRAISRAI